MGGGDDLLSNPFEQIARGPNPFSQEPGTLGSLLADPMDLFGYRAGATRDEVRNILLNSANEAIQMQNEQYRRVEEMYQPFYEGAVGAIPGLEAMVTGGEIPADYQPSKLAQLQMQRGTESIKASQAKQGLLHSSATQQRVADLASGVAAEEAERAYGGLLSQLQIGYDAGSAVNQAGQALGGNVSGLYSNLGANLNAATQAYGQARQSAYQGASNTLGQMAAYYQQRG